MMGGDRAARFRPTSLRFSLLCKAGPQQTAQRITGKANCKECCALLVAWSNIIVQRSRSKTQTEWRISTLLLNLIGGITGLTSQLGFFSIAAYSFR